MYTFNNHFCLVWKSNGTTFYLAREELKLNLKDVIIVISDKHDESFVRYEFGPQKFQSPLTNIVVYNLESFNRGNSAIPYCM